ncbi:MAG: TatD family hydrolase [Bacteroidetes bacterium]|nr:TatD family hydrolase [Bacteroidota bacterium]
MFTDTHCHLYDEVFETRKGQIEALALENGVNKILLPNIDVNSLPKMDAVAANYPSLEIRKMIGLHPCYVKEDWVDQLHQIEAWYHQKPKEFCAVGEIGLDLYWDQSTLEIQIQALNRQLDWSVAWDLPIALHVRSGFKELFPVLEAAQERHDGKIRGVFHCFSGGKKQINRALLLGEFYFGLGGSITHNRSATDPVVGNIPTDRILLETDAPYLTPSSKKGQKNEPGFMLEVAQTVSEIKGVSLNELAVLTSANAEKLFGA